MFQLANINTRINELEHEIIHATDYPEGLKKKNNDNEISIVFAGQYSAGKSSIIKMLTGIEDIEIGEGITTQQSTIYEWNGLKLIDTPGIHTELRRDHDEIAYSEISSADILVFVITNELFNSHLAEHFRKLAIERNKAGEMILVVNKMSRTVGGNTLEQQSVIKEGLTNVLKPYTPDDLHISFMDAESYLDAMNEEDEEIKEELLKRSGYDGFIETLNEFVRNKGTTSKLTTRVYELEEFLEKNIKAFEDSTDKDDLDLLEENYTQQRNTLIDARKRLKNEISDIYLKHATEIKALGSESADLISEDCDMDNVEDQLNHNMNKANDMIDDCQQEAVVIFEKRLKEVGQSLDKIENSEFTGNIKTRLINNFETLPENIQNLLTKSAPGIKNASDFVLNNAYKTGVEGGLKLSNFSGSTIHDLVLKAGHSIGYKFKPWQAIKITRGVAVFSSALSVLGIAASVFMQIKSDKDEEKRRSIIRENRQNIRAQFNLAAKGLEDAGKQFIETNIACNLDDTIADLNDSIQAIRKEKSKNNNKLKKLLELQHDCQEVIREIHHQGIVLN